MLLRDKLIISKLYQTLLERPFLDIVNQNKTTLISNGIINAYNNSQASKRSKNDNKNKGHEAASAMVKMIKCLI